MLVPNSVWGRYLFLLRYVLWPIWWLPILVLISLLMWTSAVPMTRRRLDGLTHGLLWLSLTAPFIPVWWAAIAYGWDRRDSSWAGWLLTALYGIAVGFGIWTAYRGRRVPWIALSVIGYVLTYSLFMSISGHMMIANDWAWF